MSVKKNNKRRRLQNVAAPAASAGVHGDVIRIAHCGGAAVDSVGPNSVRPRSSAARPYTACHYVCENSKHSRYRIAGRFYAGILVFLVALPRSSTVTTGPKRNQFRGLGGSHADEKDASGHTSKPAGRTRVMAHHGLLSPYPQGRKALPQQGP